ncbi:MAG: hypothetical protein E6Q97_30385 [Desulfurellales bacterium]|nr:MAG: hypothetical protein E6Q97_30385 [Desulfurellales bacterium]
MTTYVQGVRALTQLKLAGTSSFRLASTQLFDYGINSQNFDKDVIDIMAAPAGWTFIQVDQAGAEALIVAYLAADGRYRELFREGVKPHIYVALHLFLDKFRGEHPRDRYWLQRPGDLKKLPEWPALSKRIKNSEFEYDIGKRIGHAKNYRMGPFTFKLSALRDSGGTLNLSLEDCTYFSDTYNVLFPEIGGFQNEIERRIHTDRRLVNLFGHPRRFERLINDGYIREAISWIPQSTVGCITHEAALKFTDYVITNRLSWRLCNNKHDSLAALVPESEAPDAARTLAGFFQQTFTGWDGSKFTMRTEAFVGPTLGKKDMKEIQL